MPSELLLKSLSLAAVVISLSSTSLASRGDMTLLYQRCVNWFKGENCSDDGRDFLPHNPQPLYLRLARWSCVDNCRYECMWITVEAFQNDGLPVPQFHGKWPFIRWYGVQEPASALFSLLNFLMHLLMTVVFTRRIPSDAPMYCIWVTYSLFSLNAWMSSTIFHTKDTLLTEKMDYFGALAFVLCSLFAFVARYIGSGRQACLKVCAFVFCVFFVSHVYYLSFIKFDYKYNLIVNVGIGAINSVAWLMWCVPRCRQYPHNRKAVFTMCAINLLVVLELFDFPPLWWTFDAHALWHGGTVLLAIPWYLFVIDDCRQLIKERDKLVKQKSV